MGEGEREGGRGVEEERGGGGRGETGTAGTGELMPVAPCSEQFVPRLWEWGWGWRVLPLSQAWIPDRRAESCRTAASPLSQGLNSHSSASNRAGPEGTTAQ